MDDNNNVVVGKQDGKGLIANKLRGIYDKDKKGWICKNGWGVWGPYIHLTRGWHKAIFCVKATGSEWDQEEYLFEIDVAASYRGEGTEDILGDKKLNIHYITTKDVYRENDYNSYILVFYVYQDEDNVEFRVRPRSNNHTIVFGYVKLTRL